MLLQSLGDRARDQNNEHFICHNPHRRVSYLLISTFLFVLSMFNILVRLKECHAEAAEAELLVGAAEEAPAQRLYGPGLPQALIM
jgi:hypothetical protein